KPDFYIESRYPEFSDDSQHVSFAARHTSVSGEGEDILVADGKETIAAPSVREIVHSPDGKRSAYIFRDEGNRVVVVDGKPGKSYESLGNDILFSPDSKSYLFRAMLDGKTFLVVDGVDQKAYPIIP